MINTFLRSTLVRIDVLLTLGLHCMLLPLGLSILTNPTFPSHGLLRLFLLALGRLWFLCITEVPGHIELS